MSCRKAALIMSRYSWFTIYIYTLSLLQNNIDKFTNNTDFKKSIINACEEAEKTISKNTYIHNKYNIYIISFSTERDELALWNYYTKDINNIGYNIGFNLNDFTSNPIKVDSKKYNEDNSISHYYKNINFYHGKVIYDPNKQLQVLKHIVNAFENLYTPYNKDDCGYLLVDKVIYQGVFLKNPYFKHEYEYRFAFYTSTTANYPELNDIPFEYTIGQKSFINIYYNTNSVRNVTCSPTNSNKDINYPKKYIYRDFYNFNEIQKSNIPFRNI